MPSTAVSGGDRADATALAAEDRAAPGAIAVRSGRRRSGAIEPEQLDCEVWADVAVLALLWSKGTMKSRPIKRSTTHVEGMGLRLGVVRVCSVEPPAFIRG